MNSPHLEACILDLIGGIEEVTLGSVETVVINAAVTELILNWNDHDPDPDTQIDTQTELKNWEKIKKS